MISNIQILKKEKKSFTRKNYMSGDGMLTLYGDQVCGIIYIL